MHVEVDGRRERAGRAAALERDRAARCRGRVAPRAAPPSGAARCPPTPHPLPAGHAHAVPCCSTTVAATAFLTFFFTTKIVFLYVCFLLTLGLAQRRASSGKEGRFWWVCSPKWPRIWHHHCRFPVSLCKMYRVEMQQLVPEVKAFSMGESHGFQT